MPQSLAVDCLLLRQFQSGLDDAALAHPFASVGGSY